MCGICGIWSEDPTSAGPRVNTMLETIVHRGPMARDDSTGLASPLGCAGWRSSTLRGDQPIYNEDGSVGVVFNGEIYNFRDAPTSSEGHRFDTHPALILRRWFTAMSSGATTCCTAFGGCSPSRFGTRAATVCWLLGIASAKPSTTRFRAAIILGSRSSPSCGGCPADLDDAALEDYLHCAMFRRAADPLPIGPSASRGPQDGRQRRRSRGSAGGGFAMSQSCRSRSTRPLTTLSLSCGPRLSGAS